jgi:hypothetical protein
MKSEIVIANASGFWGDEAAAVTRQVRGGHIDYLTMDYLAEITMIILSRQKAKDETAGFARDFVRHVESVIEEIVDKGITVIANAGGVNPGSAAKALTAMMEAHGVDLPIAVVDGDDLMPRLPELEQAGVEFRHLDSGKRLAELSPKINSANAYIGARPIVGALRRGARIVITGRTYDAAAVVAPMVHEFGWDWTDWDRMAAALLAGHLIECGAQVTGGNYSRWFEVDDYKNMGFPLVVADKDGSFTVTKHPDTGGLVTRETVIEQTLYEIGNPAAYASPDVVADFTSFEVEETGKDAVRIRGVKGHPPTGELKVSMTYEAGHKMQASVVVSGPHAVAKARKFSEIYWGRIQGELIEKRTDLLGYDSCWGSSAAAPVEPNELLLRFSARSEDPVALGSMARELAGIALGGPAGICGAGGRPHISPAFGYWPALIPRQYVKARVSFHGEDHEFPCEEGPAVPLSGVPEPHPEIAAAPAPSDPVRVPLGRIAFGRSGDKGDVCNVGIAALSAELYPEILREVTAKRVADYFSSLVAGEVVRFPMDNLGAVNFKMGQALGGGGTVSLQTDTQGKTIAQGLLLMEIDVERALLEGVAKRSSV